MKAGETLQSLATKARVESDKEAAGKGNSVRGSISGEEDGVKTRGCGNVEIATRFPHSHSLDDDLAFALHNFKERSLGHHLNSLGLSFNENML